MDKHDHKHNKHSHENHPKQERKEATPSRRGDEHHYPGQPISGEGGPEEKEEKNSRKDTRRHK